MTTITIVDESTVGEKHAWSLDFLDETVSLRELIRQRIYQEVTEHNTRLTGHFRIPGNIFEQTREYWITQLRLHVSPFHLLHCYPWQQ